MTDQVFMRALDASALAVLQIHAGTLVIHLTGPARAAVRQLPAESGWRTTMVDNAITNPPDGWSRSTISALSVCTLIQWLISNRRWVAHKACFRALLTCGSSTVEDDDAVVAWLQRLKVFLDEHENEPAVVVPNVQLVDEAEAEAQRPGVRLTQPPPGEFRLVRRGQATDHGRPELMTPERLLEYYSAESATVDTTIEQICSPSEVGQLWDRIYTGLGVTTEDDKRSLRSQVIMYTLHNGCSPNLYTTRMFALPGGLDVSMLSVFGYFANSAGTFRRFMRGMADEAVAYLKAHPDIHPHWGMRNMADEYDRLLAFDYADGRSDLTPIQRAQMRARLEVVLDRQSRSWERSSVLPPNAGATAGPINQSSQRRRPRRTLHRGTDSDRMLED